MESFLIMNKLDHILFDFSRWKSIDFKLLLAVLLLFIIGIITLYSANSGQMNPWATKQFLRFLIFFPIFLFIIFIDLKIIYKAVYLFYFIGLILLIYVIFSGHYAMGAKRWINLGFFKLQPSEFMKIALILALARYFHNLHIYKMQNIIFLIIPILMVITPVLLIMKQPDLGTSLILFALAIVIFFVAGVGIWKFIISALAVAISAPFLWANLKAYQKQRILTFLDPESDPLGSGYNIIQSKIAIGSGGLSGKGFLSGTQGQLNFLPERETDFIFTIIAEEYGFIGSIFVMLLYCYILVRFIKISLECNCLFSKYTVTGLCFFLFLHLFINIAMITGLIPVVGAPLPFISYGGTILIISLITTALALNIDYNKKIVIAKF
ncbi:MAG: rod shape-determining protein RodA [Rickettsiales bacterium]